MTPAVEIQAAHSKDNKVISYNSDFCDMEMVQKHSKAMSVHQAVASHFLLQSHIVPWTTCRRIDGDVGVPSGRSFEASSPAPWQYTKLPPKGSNFEVVEITVEMALLGQLMSF